MAAVAAIQKSILHLLDRFLHSPALLGYVAVGTLAAFLSGGWSELFSEAVNLCLLAFFAVVIFIFTTNRSGEPVAIKRPAAELIAGFVLFALIFLGDVFFFHLIKFTPFNRLSESLYQSAFVFCSGVPPHPPKWLADYLGNAMMSTVVELIPALLLFLAFGYGVRGMGLKNHFWKLTLILLVLSILFGLSGYRSLPLYQYPLQRTLMIYFVSLFINGIPEELFMRGYLLPRLERCLKSPDGALVATSLLFSIAHIPVHIANGSSPLLAVVGAFSISYPSGLLWGYLYQRTRSVVPGILFHESVGILGGYFL